MLVAVSADSALLGSLSRAAFNNWPLHRCDDTGAALRALSTGDTRLLVIDDDALSPGFCNCVIAGARQFAPAAKIIYVTGRHHSWREAEVRRAGVHFYTAKPVDQELLSRVAWALVKDDPRRPAAA
jgi:DNA-binding response OmpR family regulator